MYLIRRVAKTQSGKGREVAGYLSNITKAYEEAGRSKAMVYMAGWGLPGSPDVVYADWTQERIEPTNMQTVPEAVGVNHAKMAPLLTDYYLEFYELVT
jgi:hypothetical protein